MDAPLLSVNVMVLGCTSSLKAAVTGLCVATAVAFAAGVCAVTVGAVVPGADVVVKVHVIVDIVLP